MRGRLRRKPVAWVLVLVVAAGAAFGLYWFEPWRLVTSTTVADEVPVVATPAASDLDLRTSDGPDLRVWLTDQTVGKGSAGRRVFDDGRHLEVAKLRGNRGNEVYDLPAETDLGLYRSVTIWCRRFSVSFGAAELTAA